VRAATGAADSKKIVIASSGLREEWVCHGRDEVCQSRHETALAHDSASIRLTKPARKC